MACTNCPNALDSALKRRFSRTVNVGVPTPDERRHIFKVVTRGEDVGEPMLTRLVNASEGFTGSDIASAFCDACNARLEGVSEKSLKSSTTGSDVVAKLGPLTDVHWKRCERLRLPLCPRQNGDGGSNGKEEREKGEKDDSLKCRPLSTRRPQDRKPPPISPIS